MEKRNSASLKATFRKEKEDGENRGGVDHFNNVLDCSHGSSGLKKGRQLQIRNMDENVEAEVTETAAEFSETERGGVPYLPESIVNNIIGRLSVKCLVRFKSVCKYWHDIICKLLMLKVMIIYSTKDSRNLFFKLKNNFIDGCLCFERNNMWVEKACNNFVLLRRTFEDGDMLYVYDTNTIDPQCRQLPKIPGFDLRPTDTCSLVCDASAKTSKVIVFHGNDSQCYSICSLNGGSENWRTSSLPVSQEIMESCVPVDLNGVLYWVAKDDDYQGDAVMQRLDIAKEELMSIIEFPFYDKPLNGRKDPYRSQPWSINCHLLKIKGSLCFMNPGSIDELHIWVLEDSANSTWSLQRRISLSSMVNRPDSLRSFLHDGFHPRVVAEGSSITYILVVVTKDGISSPYWYNMEMKELIQITRDCNNMKACDLRIVSFFDFDLAPEFLVPEVEDLPPELEHWPPELENLPLVFEWDDMPFSRDMFV